MWKFIIMSDLISHFSESLEIRTLFSETLALRFKGYRQYYGTDSIPQDAYDFIGSHLIIAKAENNKLTPKICLRSVTNKQTDLYQKQFPFIEHMFEAHESQIKDECENFISDKKNICYTNNYTIDPDLAPEEKAALMEMMFGFYYLYHSEKDVTNFITATSDKFKVYKTRMKQGYRYLNDDSEFSTFVAPHIMNEKFRAMVMTEFSLESRNLAKKYANFYNEKLDLRQANLEISKKAA